MSRFRDREEAGLALAELVAARGLPDPVVLALPRGGVPVGLEVARRLRAPLDLVMVRKIGVPYQPELAAAAVVNGDAPGDRRQRRGRRPCPARPRRHRCHGQGAAR